MKLMSKIRRYLKRVLYSASLMSDMPKDYEYIRWLEEQMRNDDDE